MNGHQHVTATILVLTLCACGSDKSDHGAKKASPAPTTLLTTVLDGSKSCPPAPPNPAAHELKGGSESGVSLYGLFFTTYPVPHGEDAKIAWRMTGDGELSLSATGPDGTPIRPIRGPAPHFGSSWRRPGDEWGSAFRFTKPGCWTVHATRGSDEATASLLVR